MAEGIPARRERLSSRATKGIDALIEHHPELELTSFAEAVDGVQRTLMFVAPKGMQLPDGLPRLVLEYQAREGLATEEKIGKRDCVLIAGKAVNDLERRMLTFGDCAVGVMTTTNTNGEEIPLFKEQGFGRHAINFLEMEDGSCVSFDLTAHYNMDAGQGRYDVFAIGAPSMPELQGYLKDLSGSRWED